eukprot:scaffold644819_cov45-Prasinocladus_malaysianus.AAC.1
MECYGFSDSYESDEEPSHCSTSSNEDVDLPFSEAEQSNGTIKSIKSSWQVIDRSNLEALQ